MPQNTFLALAILLVERAALSALRDAERPWGPTPLADQQLAGGIMWVAGDLVFLAAIMCVVAGWMRHEERDRPAADRAGRDAERGGDPGAARCVLAERLADEREQRRARS